MILFLIIIKAIVLLQSITCSENLHYMSHYMSFCVYCVKHIKIPWAAYSKLTYIFWGFNSSEFATSFVEMEKSIKPMNVQCTFDECTLYIRTFHE